MANLKYLSSALLTNIRTAEKLLVGGMHPKGGGGKKKSWEEEALISGVREKFVTELTVLD